MQPSSIDVRLDKYFRVFNNSRYTHIDPKQPMDDLTTMVEVPEEEPFVLHPGEFVLASTLEMFTLPEDLAGRLLSALDGSEAVDVTPGAILLTRRLGPAQLLEWHSRGIAGVVIEEGSPGGHAAIHPDVPQIANVGYLVDGLVLHPGDAFTVPDAAVELLLVPIAAPWLKTATVPS